jgi:hypothetical protein
MFGDVGHVNLDLSLGSFSWFSFFFFSFFFKKKKKANKVKLKQVSEFTVVSPGNLRCSVLF